MSDTNGLSKYIQFIYSKYRSSHRLYRIALVAVALILICTTIYYKRSSENDYIQENIAKEIIRFHVLANSDDEKDQKLKLTVKTKVVEYLQEKLNTASNLHEAKAVIIDEMSNLQGLAKQVIEQEGYDYSVSVELGQSYFPVKCYGDLTFPAGEYQALRVLIGKAEGKNWWCVMFPSLCLVNESYSVVPWESKDKLKYVLSEEEYNSLEENDCEMTNTPEPTIEPTIEPTVEPTQTVEFRFRILDFFRGIW